MAKAEGPMSGFRDMLAEQMIPRQDMLDTIQGVYELYGFTPLKTPAIERFETLNGKYGEEGQSLMYRFKDNGKRDVALRYDQTVPLARVVAMHRPALPYKRYVVGEVWRGESPQAGRYREFTQFDADVVGDSSSAVDAEIVAMMSHAMSALGADSLIRVNNRRILDGLVEKAGLDPAATASFVGTIDKIDKIGLEAVVASLAEKHGDFAAETAKKYLSSEGSTKDRLDYIAKLLDGSEAAAEGVANLREVFSILETAGFSTDKIVFDPSTARGLSYYTGIIFETTLKDAPELGSVCSGGRYDRLIESLGGPNLPAVGTSIGVDRLYDGLHKLGLLREVKTNTQVMLTNFESVQAANYEKLATQLRFAGIATEIYHAAGDKMGKQLKFASNRGIPQVVIIGPTELERGIATIKSMHTGTQVEVPLADIVGMVKELGAVVRPGTIAR